MTVAVRRATVDDAEVVAALEAAAAQEPWSLPAVRQQLAAPHTLAFLAFLAGERVPSAYLIASAVADEGELLTVGVDPAKRRAGLGAALVAACQAAWREAGVATAYLEVRADNTPAIALYERLGWRAHGGRPRYYRDGADALLLCWRP